MTPTRIRLGAFAVCAAGLIALAIWYVADASKSLPAAVPPQAPVESDKSADSMKGMLQTVDRDKLLKPTSGGIKDGRD